MRLHFRLLVLGVFLSTSWSALPAHAGELMDLSVINRSTGQPLQIYPHHQQLYVAGNPGDRYGVQLRNHSGQRVMAVISVDGINALTGETASSQQSGYVLNPGQSYRIDGWRKSDSEIAQFVFTDPSNSYAKRTGRPKNIGVIGVAVFPELDPVLLHKNKRQSEKGTDGDQSGLASMESNTSKMNAARSAPSAQLGTGHGDREYAPTQSTEFQAASTTPSEILVIHYDRLDNLIAKGIVPRPRVTSTTPNPFPADRFVPDPPK